MGGRLPPCGFTPDWTLVDVNGQVLDTFVHDLIVGR